MPKPRPMPPVEGPGPSMPMLWPLVIAIAGVLIIGGLVGAVLQVCR